MSKRLLFLMGVLIITATTSGAYIWQTSLKNTLQERAVSKLVYSFGGALKNVSLHADRHVAAASIATSYGAFISPNLLASWQADPTQAPGYLATSPWPERIEIQYVDKLNPLRYMVTGNIIEATSANDEQGHVVARRPIVLSVEKTDKTWRITHVVLGAYE